jgi:ribose 5-phosphate isomerase A
LRPPHPKVAARKVSEMVEPSVQNQWKKAAAEAAARLIEDGMAVGLGTGSTAAFFIEALGRRISEERLRVTGIPTSMQTVEQARDVNIPLTSFADRTHLDITVDGADEVEGGTLYAIKGHGGALLREKIVAAASRRMVIVCDETKIVKKLGSLASVPVEVVQFGWEVTQRKLEDLGSKPVLRMTADRKPYITDGGHYIIDCAYGPMEKPKDVAHHLDHVVGAVEHGLFLGFAREVLVGGPSGVNILKSKES